MRFNQHKMFYLRLFSLSSVSRWFKMIRSFFINRKSGQNKDLPLDNNTKEDHHPDLVEMDVPSERPTKRTEIGLNMEELIPIINELQTIFQKTGIANNIELPQIVVVGAQSSGKSSVLESLVGKSFLPKGSGMVTRCPITIQLIQEPEEGDDNDGWYAVFQNDELNEKYKDCDKVREEIERLTDKLCNKGISTDPIILQVHSSKVVNLTVVDLPGIVKIAVKGQPDDIDEIIDRLIMAYIKNPNAIILAVSPANVDIATSDSIKMAARVDPDKERTLAVVTKLDLVDEGTDPTKVLLGKIIPVKLGIIGVVNRSQLDIQNNKTIEEAMIFEEEFLQKTYPHLAHRNGSRYLAERLSQLLLKHIPQSLPGLREQIVRRIEIIEKKLEFLGRGIPEDLNEKRYYLEDALKDFVDRFTEFVRDRRTEDSLDNEFHFARDIANLFSEFSRNLRDMKYCDHRGLKAKIREAILVTVNFEGFTSIEVPFKALTKQHIAFLEDLCVKLADQVHAILKKVAEESAKDEKLPYLNDEMRRIVKHLLDYHLRETKAAVKEHILIQSCMIFSEDEEFYRLLKIFPSENGPSEVLSEDEDDDEDENKCEDALDYLLAATIPGTSNSSSNNATSSEASYAAFPMGSLHDKDTTQITYVQKLITKYCGIIQNQMADFIPKHIFYHIFENTVSKMKQQIRRETAGREAALICETAYIISERKEAEEKLENLQKAKEVIDRATFTF